MDDLELLLELEIRDLEIFREVAQLTSDRDELLQKIDRDTPKLEQLAAANSPEALERLEKYFQELFN